MHTSELITLADAAKRSQRSASTLRRWVRGGKLTRHEGEPSSYGGSAPLLIDTQELMVLLVVSEQEPRVHQVSTPVATPGIHAEHAPVHQMPTAPTDHATQVELTRLRGQLEAAELRTELAKLTAERDALQGQVVTMAKRHAAEMNRVETETANLRADVQDWRERNDAREAELRAMRGMTGTSWWRRLLPGPTASPSWEEA